MGGIDTGCLDVEARGLLGYATIFNSLVPRRGPINLPFSGMSIDRQTWVLTTLDIPWREGEVWDNTYQGRSYCAVKNASEIHYWGHYPVADMEFATDAPVQVGLRAWSPFVPGDVAVSNTPGAVFEVHLRNVTDAPKNGTLAFTFPGPTEEEAATLRFTRRYLGGSLNGTAVESPQASYALGVIGSGESPEEGPRALVPRDIRTGGPLLMDGGAWATIEDHLPYVKDGGGLTVAADFSLGAGEHRVIRFVLAWHAADWMGGGTMSAGGNRYTHMYAKRYADVGVAVG